MESDLTQQFQNQFLEEAEDLLATIEECGLSMSNDTAGLEVVNTVFRAFHTLKGGSAMLGFNEVAGFTHHVETLLDQVRGGAARVTEELSSLILASADHIKLMLAQAQGGKAVKADSQTALLNRIERQTVQRGATPAAPVVEQAAGPTQWVIQFRPDPAVFARGCEPVLLFDDLKKLGECTIECHTDLLPDLEALDPAQCRLWWTIRLTTAAGRNAIQDVFLFVGSGGGELEIEPDTAAKPAESSKDQTATLAAAVHAQPKEATVRVPAERLDRLVNLVGELVMNQSRLVSAASRLNAPELAGPVEEIERLVAALRDDVLQIRMMPIGTIFARFRRLVHDLSRDLGKEITLVTEGEDTELDKSVLDQLGEPLVHLLRNSIDHGIEAAEEREACGKPRHGTIRLTASHRGSDVVVSIEDDGAGINRSAVRAKALARGLITPEANLSDKEILNLIVMPGFSTAESVTSVSGRGVGMDVVKRQIDALHGRLSLSSEPGRGACVSLTLPLTLAIIEGLLVQAGETQYIIPMAAVTENVDLPVEDRARNNGRNVIAVRGELIPYIDVRALFGMEGTGPRISKIVLVRYEDQRVGLVVDHVMGTHQTVIQALGRLMRKVEVVSGSTVMGDGQVALILDIAGIVRLAQRGGRGEEIIAA